NFGVAKITDRIGLCPKADLAFGEGVIVDGKQFLAVERATNLVAFASNRQLVPDATGDFDFRPNRGPAHSLDDFIKSERSAERAGADDVIIFFILNAKGDSSHLLDRTAHRFEARRQCEVT